MSKKNDALNIFWWLGWIAITILSFFASCYFWTGFIAKRVGDMHEPSAPFIWIATVFGTWMVLLVPLIIVMYNKVDKAYEDARINRERKVFEQAQTKSQVRSIFIDKSKRMLPLELKEKLSKIPEAIRYGHLVTATFRDGRNIPYVFIQNREEVLGVYDQASFPFDLKNIVDLKSEDLDKLPPFEPSRWLRLDG